MYDEVVARASRPPGMYQLAAPTGAGKTQMGLGWALAHAEANGLRRVVTAVPYITVTDQVASDYRRLLDGPDRVVVEHHSQVTGDDGWARWACENWDAPVVVTTTVRLFESLFAATPSSCRRLHRLTGSVIIVDEVQAIPVEVLEPVLDALRALVERFGATVLLMTATQPTLEHVRPTRGRPPEDLLAGADRWSAAFDRTQIQQLERKVTRADVATMIAEHRQCLCITNTIADAREVTRATGNPDVLHLSTMLRPADRRARIGDIRRRLDAGSDCQVISTQLIEAGVDLDFPVVLRAVAPLPSLVQADGRCNRNGRQPSPGQTIVFDLADGSRPPPGSYFTHGTVATRVMLATPERDLRASATIAEWYRRFLTDPAVTLDARNVQRARSRFRYQTTADRFRMIDDDTVSVAVPWPADDRRALEVDDLLERLANQAHIHLREARALQDVTVSLRLDLAEQALAAGLAERISDHLLVWRGDYHPQVGLVLAADLSREARLTT
jgi:CRISPR-associated endonuclease/helicase Cas3